MVSHQQLNGHFWLQSEKLTNINELAESYAKNDIKSKMDGKQYWDKTAYEKAYQGNLQGSVSLAKCLLHVLRHNAQLFVMGLMLSLTISNSYMQSRL